MKQQPSRQGFTIVELMLAMTAFSILVLAVGSMLVFVWKGWRDYSEAVGLQRDAMVSIRLLNKEIRNSNIDELSGDASGMYFSVGSTRTNAFQFLSSNIPYNPGVDLYSWSEPVIGSNYVDIAFTLRTRRGTYQKTYEMTVYPRNAP
jgi:prepilin-type N-terminal cleavage/methylation domain-containing protein